MKLVLDLFSAFLMVSALGVEVFSSDPKRGIVMLSSGSVGVYFYFQARTWTPEKSLRIFGIKPRNLKNTDTGDNQ